MRRILLLITMCLSALSIHAQTGQLRGTVVEKDGSPLTGASVVVQGTNTGAVSDAEGKFVLTVPGPSAVIEVSFLGYETQTIAVGNRTELNVVMEYEENEMEKVIVVGYGTQKKIHLTGSVAAVDSQELLKRNASNVSSALQGLVPGMAVTQQSGEPGSDGGTIRIRGEGSFLSSSDPLVLIDGVQGNMNMVDPTAIESISVLKDAASAAIYGSRAANGVILITTKRGKDKGVNVSYSGSVRFDTPTDLPEPVSVIEYMELMNHALQYADQPAQFSDKTIQHYRLYGADNVEYYDTDWKSAILKNFSLSHRHAATVTGGSDAVNYLVNGTYYYQDGLITNNDYKRFTLRSNADIKITSWMTLGIDLNYAQGNKVEPAMSTTQDIVARALSFAPTFGGINKDGTWADGHNGQNPIAVVRAGGTRNILTPELEMRGRLQINPVEGFFASANFTRRTIESKTDSFVTPYKTYYYGNHMNTFGTDTKTESWQRSVYDNFILQASYDREINGHYFKAMVGMQSELYKTRSLNGVQTGYDIPGYEQISDGTGNSSLSGTRSHYALASYFSRLNYAYKDKYLLELIGRYDGSSRFAKGRRWGFFPSVSAGWVVSKEDFFVPAANVVNTLKIRLSYGQLGNQDIGSYYPYTTTIGVQGDYYNYYYFNDTIYPGSVSGTIANPLISWERSHQYNFGLDLDMFQNRLSVTFDYYRRYISDMLQQFPIPALVGDYTAPYENAGDMRNVGWDLSVSWRQTHGDFNYKLTGTLSDVKNKVTNLHGNKYETWGNYTNVGYPLKSYYGWLADGYFQSQEEINTSPTPNGNSKSGVKPGDIKYVDVSGPNGEPDGVIDDYDRVVLGNRAVRFDYGLRVDAQWKNFDLSLFFQGVGKRDIFMTGLGVRPFIQNRTIYKSQLDFWTEDNRNAEFPRLFVGEAGTYNNYQSSFWIKSGAYLRLKNAVIGYTLPKKVSNKLRLSNIRVYASGSNLFTVSDAYKGFDPELPNGGFYPILRSFTFGIDIRL